MTSFIVNHGWTPETIAQDKALKEKYGNSAHITPVSSYQIPESYKHGLKVYSEQDTYSFKTNKEHKSHKKMSVFTKVLIATALGAFGILAFKNNTRVKKSFNELINSLKGTKKTPASHHAPVAVTDKDKAMLEKCLDKMKKSDLYKTKSKFTTKLINESDDLIKVKYSSDAPFSEGHLYRNLQNDGSKSASIKLKDGKEVAIQYNPNIPNAAVKFPEFYTWESGGLDIGLYGLGSYDEALKTIAEGLKKHGYDSTAIVDELKNLMTL